MNDKFSVFHFAGEVQYYIEGFLEKNNDTLYTDLEVRLCSRISPLRYACSCLVLAIASLQVYFTPGVIVPPAVTDAQQQLRVHSGFVQPSVII